MLSTEVKLLTVVKPVSKLRNHYAPNALLAKRVIRNKMPVSCCAVGCTSRFRKGAGVGFYVFPVDQRRREMWIQAISRVGASGRK